VFVWGLPPMKSLLDGLATVRIPVPGLHELVARVPLVVDRPTPEAAVYNFIWLSTPGTGVVAAAVVAGLVMQRITAQQLGLDPTLMAAANSSGGVMGKMIDAQSIVVATAATRWYGHEGEILRNRP